MREIDTYIPSHVTCEADRAEEERLKLRSEKMVAYAEDNV